MVKILYEGMFLNVKYKIRKTEEGEEYLITHVSMADGGTGNNIISMLSPSALANICSQIYDQKEQGK